MTIWPKWSEDRVYAITIFVLIVSAVIYLGVKTDNILRQSQQIDQPAPYEHSISIEGEGKAIGKPDIATIDMSTSSKGIDAATAQQANNTVMNKIIEETKALQISEDDIQTSNYSIYEDTQWNPETNISESKGWIVSNSVTIKVRDTSKLSSVLTMAAQNGITSISGPTFTIDDTTNLKAEARSKAIAQAKTKAETIATSLGMKIEKAVGYSEWAPTNYPDYSYALNADSLKSTITAPTIQTGTNEVVLNVTITYKLVE